MCWDTLSMIIINEMLPSLTPCLFDLLNGFRVSVILHEILTDYWSVGLSPRCPNRTQRRYPETRVSPESRTYPVRVSFCSVDDDTGDLKETTME